MTTNSDGHEVEPSMIILCSDFIDLYNSTTIKCRHRYRNYKDKATKNLRKFNRRTLSN